MSAQSIHRNAAADQALDELGLEAGAPAAISLDAGSLPAGGVSLTRTLPKPVAGDADAALAFFDEEHRAWTVVPTSLSPSRRELRADVDHLSLWTDIQYGAGWLLDARVDPPACSGSPPDWVQEDGIIFVDDANAPLRWCAGRDPQDADVLVVKVALNRSYGVGVRPVVRPEWTFDTLFGGGPETFATTLVTRGAGALGLLGEAYGGHIPLMGGMEAHFGFTEQQVRSIGGPALIRVSLDAKFALAGFTYRALHELAGEGKLGKQASAIAALVAIAQCQSDLGRGAQRGEWQALAQAGVFCLTENSEAISNLTALTLTTALPNANPRTLGRLSGRIGGKLWQVWAAGSAFQVASWVADRKLIANARELHVFPKVVRRRPKPRPLDAFVGTWAGPVEQTPPARVDYGVEFSLRRSGSGVKGDVEYPELDCGGTLAFVRNTPSGKLVMRERITYGNCVQDCTVEIGAPDPTGAAAFGEICDGPSTVEGIVRKK